MSWDPKAAPKLDFDEDFYSVLEVDPSIGSKDLKRAYYKIVFMYHPDNKEGDEAKAVANKQMMVINGAYRILKNSFLRKLYDKQRKRGLFGVKAGVKESDAGGSRGGSKNNEDDDPDPPANSNVPPSTKYRSATNSETTEAYGRADGGERGSGRPATSTGSGNSKGGSSYSSSSATDEEFIRDSYRRQRERFNAYQSESEPQPQPQPQRVTSNAEDGDDSTGGESRYYRGGGFDTSYVEGGRGDTRSQDVFNDNMLDEVAEFLRRTGTAVSGRFISTIQALRSELQQLKNKLKAKMIVVEIGNRRDWGEVTDPVEVRKRLNDMKEVELLKQQVAELEEQIADLMLRGRVSQPFGYSEFGDGTSFQTPQRSRSSNSRAFDGTAGVPFDLWGEGSSQSWGGDDDSLLGGDDQRDFDYDGDTQEADSAQTSWRRSYEQRRNPQRKMSSSTEPTADVGKGRPSGPRRSSGQSVFDELQKYFKNTNAKRSRGDSADDAKRSEGSGGDEDDSDGHGQEQESRRAQQ